MENKSLKLFNHNSFLQMIKLFFKRPKALIVLNQAWLCLTTINAWSQYHNMLLWHMKTYILQFHVITHNDVYSETKYGQRYSLHY